MTLSWHRSPWRSGQWWSTAKPARSPGRPPTSVNVSWKGTWPRRQERCSAPHRVEGVVVHGDHRGRELGYPTANLEPVEHAAVPADGVYAGWLVRRPGRDGEESLPAAISIGTNPTFDGEERRVEAYALDRTDLDLYGEHVAFDFVERLRPTLKFDGVDTLLVQMADDVTKAREILTP